MATADVNIRQQIQPQVVMSNTNNNKDYIIKAHCGLGKKSFWNNRGKFFLNSFTYQNCQRENTD